MLQVDVAGQSRACGGPGDSFYAVQPLRSGGMAFLMFEAGGSFWNDADDKAARDVHSGFRLACAGQPPDLGAWACALNEPLLGSAPRFYTVFVGMIHTARRQLEFVSAGFSGAFLRRAKTREVERLSHNLPLLGVVEIGSCTPSLADVRDGDLLLLVTSGVPDTVNDSRERLGEDAIVDLLRNGEPTPPAPDAWIRRLFERLDQHGRPNATSQAALVLSVVARDF